MQAVHGCYSKSPAQVDQAWTGKFLRREHKADLPVLSRSRLFFIRMHTIICQAVREQRVLELRYHGYSRIVEPHIYGQDRNGDEVVRCYQLAGGSESGERAGWKMLKIKEAVLVHLEPVMNLPGSAKGS